MPPNSETAPAGDTRAAPDASDQDRADNLIVAEPTDSGTSAVLVTDDLNTRRTDLLLYLRAVYDSNTEGQAHWAAGIDGTFSGDGKYVFADWRQHHFTHPGETDKAVDAILCAATKHDIYLCPYLMWADKRVPGATITRGLLHIDWDGALDDVQICLDKVAEIGGFAVASGTPGHLQIYAPLASSVTAKEHRSFCEALHRWLPPGSDKKLATNDVFRPPGTLNHKGRAAGESSVVTWMIRPTGASIETDTLARLLGTDSPSSAPRTVVNGTAAAEPAALELPRVVRKALAEVTGDRSEDTMRVVGAGYDAGLTLSETRRAVNTREDLAQRVAEFLARTTPVDDVQTCWDRVTDDRQAQKRQRIQAQEFSTDA